MSSKLLTPSSQAVPPQRPCWKGWCSTRPLVLTEDAEGIVGLDVWGGCVTEYTEEVQEVLKAQAVSGWGSGEDPADSLLEGVGLGKKALYECHRMQPKSHTQTPLGNWREQFRLSRGERSVLWGQHGAQEDQ